MKIRRYIVEYKLGASNRKVHLHYDAYAFSLLANRCLRCGFNSPEEKVHTQLGTKSVAVSTTVTCVAGSELEQFILSLPHGADRMF